jgi:hypothetical protein
MHIPSYHINNVLKVYSKQVSQCKVLERQRTIGQKTSADKINISNEGKRRVIIDKVAAGIVDKITRFGPNEQNPPAGTYAAEDEAGQPDEAAAKDKNNFVYNVIDDQNNKKTNTLSIESSNFVTQQFMRLSEEEG